MTSGSTADRCEFKVEHMCWCSAAASAAKTERHQFGSHPPKVTEDLSLISSHLPAPCSSFFTFGFKTNFISAIFENELEEKNIKPPPLTPSCNMEEESVFGTWSASKRWSEVISKSLQEREFHVPRRIHSSYPPRPTTTPNPRSSTCRAACWIQGSRHEPIWQLESTLAELSAASAAQRAHEYFCGATGCNHSPRRCKADLGCGTNLYTWSQWRITKLEPKVSRPQCGWENHQEGFFFF